ncbi:phage tail protein [Paenibacillus sp. GYB004]|uniref:phage tail protein n=1 Tax=Paenibacillus sp. GYB004 TaxID=2994393 RepID=UPI002F968547
MITVDADKVKEIEQRLGEIRKQAPVVLSRALNRAAANAKTNASKKVRETYTLRAKDVNETFSVRKASRGNLSAAVTSRSGSIGLDKFKVRPLEPRHSKPPKSLKVQVRKEGGAKKLVGAFVASVSGNKVFQREKGSQHKKGRSGRWTELPIKRLFGPPVPEMLDRRSIREFVEQEAAQTFDKNLEHEIKRALEG